MRDKNETSLDYAEVWLIEGQIIENILYSMISCLLFGTKKKNIQHLQRLQNSAARLIFQAHQRDSVSSMLIDLHWLPINERILFRNLTYVHKCLNDNAPAYFCLSFCTPMSQVGL